METKIKTYGDYRKQIYASINGTKSNLTKLKKSKLLSKTEKEKLQLVIDALETLRVEYYNNRGRETKEMKCKKNQCALNLIFPNGNNATYACDEKCYFISCDEKLKEHYIKKYPKELLACGCIENL